MRRIAFAVPLFAALLTVAACGGSTDGNSAAGPSKSVAAQATSAAAAPAANQDCGTGSWPRPLPDFRGKPLGETVVGAALCFDITSITSTDGHDVKQDAAAATKPWKVTQQTPAPGTQVGADTPVTLTVEAPH